MFDASMIPTPTGLPPIPTGTFYFSLGNSGYSQRGCLVSSLENNAWSCGVPTVPLLIEIGSNAKSPTVKVYPANAPAGMDGVQYGSQPPRIQPMQKMVWVKDLQEPSRGPALHFQTVYDKIVVIQADQFPSPGLKARNPEHGRDLNRDGLD